MSFRIFFVQNEVCFVQTRTAFCHLADMFFLCGMKPILTITGSDSTGGSGIQADIKTISELGEYAVTVITSITVQTTLGILDFYDVPSEVVGGQIEAVMNDLQPQVIKIGMVRTAETLNVIVGCLEKYKPRYVILDTVTLSSRGDMIIDETMALSIRKVLAPLCDVVVDNVSGNTHGQSCWFSSSLACYLNQGLGLDEAKTKADAYVKMMMARCDSPKGRCGELYEDFLRELQKHYRHASDVHFYAECLNVSSRYLAQVTKRVSGKSPKNIIDELLVREIEIQLKSTDYNVQEVAYMFGFSSQAHFTKFFKKLKGVSPSEYRRLL